MNAQRQATARSNAAAAVAAANAAAAHWPVAPAAVTRSGMTLIRKPIREGELGSDGQPMPARPGGDTPSNVLWVRVTNVVVPVTLGALYELFGAHGKVKTPLFVSLLLYMGEFYSLRILSITTISLCFAFFF